MKLDKYVIIAVLIAAAAGLVATGLYFLFSLLGWGVIWVLTTIFLIPIIHALINVYIKYKCSDLEDLWEVLTKEPEMPNQKNEEIRIINSRNNNYYDGFS